VRAFVASVVQLLTRPWRSFSRLRDGSAGRAAALAIGVYALAGAAMAGALWWRGIPSMPPTFPYDDVTFVLMVYGVMPGVVGAVGLVHGFLLGALAHLTLVGAPGAHGARCLRFGFLASSAFIPWLALNRTLTLPETRTVANGGGHSG